MGREEQIQPATVSIRTVLLAREVTRVRGGGQTASANSRRGEVTPFASLGTLGNYWSIPGNLGPRVRRCCWCSDPNAFSARLNECVFRHRVEWWKMNWNWAQCASPSKLDAE